MTFEQRIELGRILTDAQVDTSNGYYVLIRITGYSQEYHGILNIGTGVLLPE